MPDFVKDPHMADVFELIHTSPKIHLALEWIFGSKQGTAKHEYRYIQHNDIGLNIHTSEWHKDRLNGPVRGYEIHDPWSVVDGQRYQIVKVGMYMEDHEDPWDHTALRVMPGSHNATEIPRSKTVKFLHPAAGDICIWDQRISHRGQGVRPSYEQLVPEQKNTSGRKELLDSSATRILLQMGYGMNNIHTDFFERGTVMRQELMYSPDCNGAYNSCALAKVHADLKKHGWYREKCFGYKTCPWWGQPGPTK